MTLVYTFRTQDILLAKETSTTRAIVRIVKTMRQFALLAVLLHTVLAVFVDEAYNIDYHYALLGEPQESTTFFHRPNSDSRASLIYTLSEQHGLGALNPRDGSVVWRHLLQPITPSNNTFLRAADGGDIVVSGVGSELSAWSSSDGKLAWTHRTPGELEDVEVMEFGTEKDTIALSSGARPVVVRIGDVDGRLKWTHKIDSGDAPYQLSVTPTKLYLVLLHKTMLGYFKLKVISLEPATGAKIDEYTLSSENELASSETILTVGANSASPIIAWTDAARSLLKVNVLGSKNVASFPIKQVEGRAVTSISLHAPYHANSVTHFLVHLRTSEEDWAEVYHINSQAGKVEKAYSLPMVRGSSAFTTATIDASVYFTRVTDSEVITVSSASHGILGRWPISSFGVKGPVTSVKPEFAVSELSLKGSSVSAIRLAVWLSTGEFVLLHNGAPTWRRPEALADIVRATFTQPAAKEQVRESLEATASKNAAQAYIERLARHLQQLPAIGSLLDRLPGRSTSSSNTFGFEQTVTCATRKGLAFVLEVGGVKPEYSCLPSAAVTLEELRLQERHIVTSNGTATYSYERKDGDIMGFAAAQKQIPIWTFTPKKNEHILSIFPRPEEDPVSSIGIVLGNRDVLYKYLNPNLALVVTANDVARSAGFHILDTVSGAILHSSNHERVDLSMPIVGTMSESWFAYSFTAAGSAGSPKGHRLVAGELFESLASNDRGVLDTAQKYSSFSTTNVPFVLEKIYHTSEPISYMTVTRTAQGITSRQLLAVLPESNSIIGIPRGAIDPRRPMREPTKDEQMEGLTKYNPALEFDPRWYLNHKREVLGVQHVLASPAVLESTSLIFVYGFDVFGTRLSPSFNFDMLGKDFNKFQMLATVAALAVATLVVGPLVSGNMMMTTDES